MLSDGTRLHGGAGDDRLSLFGVPGDLHFDASAQNPVLASAFVGVIAVTGFESFSFDTNEEECACDLQLGAGNDSFNGWGGRKSVMMRGGTMSLPIS